MVGKTKICRIVQSEIINLMTCHESQKLKFPMVTAFGFDRLKLFCTQFDKWHFSLLTYLTVGITVVVPFWQSLFSTNTDIIINNYNILNTEVEVLDRNIWVSPRDQVVFKREIRNSGCTDKFNIKLNVMINESVMAQLSYIFEWNI